MNSLLHLASSDLANLGVGDWGYTEEPLSQSFLNFIDWVRSGRADDLSYLTDHRCELREDLRLVYPDFESALVFLFPYPRCSKKSTHSRVASYALSFQGKDYHTVIQERLQMILSELKLSFANLEGVTSVDIKPILEKDLAVRAGLGWIGKNSLLINLKLGSYFLIGSILLNKKIAEFKKAKTYLMTDHCGSCHLCLDTCPTSAIVEEKRFLDVKKCISYFTIEQFKESAAPIGYQTLTENIFGCDLCQQICPWNQKVQMIDIDQEKDRDNQLIQFFQRKSLKEIYQELSEMSNREFRRVFRSTVMARTGRVGLMKNIAPYLK